MPPSRLVAQRKRMVKAYLQASPPPAGAATDAQSKQSIDNHAMWHTSTTRYERDLVNALVGATLRATHADKLRRLDAVNTERQLETFVYLFVRAPAAFVSVNGRLVPNWDFFPQVPAN